MRIADIVSDSIVDGPGLRLTVFTQGCPHRCPGCHNPETHDIHGGRELSPDALLPLLDNPLLDGLTLSGGEPFLQATDCARLAQAAHARGLSVWTYTGYTYEALLAEGDAERLRLLEETDILVDGPFLLPQRSLSLDWRGSRNQRILDVRASRAAGQAAAWHPPADHLAQFTRPES